MSNVDNKHIIIGTAGHIDHGKTTLIKALTGKNTDRLKEEQERGISIDLGFSYIDTPNGYRLGIVDVPGHERFINNMVAGVVGMDLILLVIAADEGIMPQTKEHMDILSLLGVKKSIIVLNKIDTVDQDWLELVEFDIKSQLSDTFLHNSPIVKVSSSTGQGIDNLISIIEKTAKSDVKERNKDAVAYLPIDRVFTIKGAGTVITGTLISGTIKAGTELEIFPVEQFCKIRSVQVHDCPTEIAYAGQRVALNLSNIKKEDIYRGCVITEKNKISPTDIIDVRLNVLKSSKRIIENGSRLHFFSGTSEVLAKVFLLDTDKVEAGQSTLAQLRFDKKIAIRKDDRFIVRFYSPLETIGGGIVLEANAIKCKRYDKNTIDILKRLESGSIDDNILLYLDNEMQPIISTNDLQKKFSVSRVELDKILEKFIKDSMISSYKMQNLNIIWSNKNKESVINSIIVDLNNFHKKYPYKPGILKAEIFRKYFKNSKQIVFDNIMEEFDNSNILNWTNEYLSDTNFEICKDATFKNVENIILEELDRAKFNFVWFSDLDFGKVQKNVVNDILSYMLKEGSVIKVSENLYTLPKYIDEAKEKIIDVLKRNKKITIIEVRDMFSTTRKTAKPILEYMDSLGITVKTGGESEREALNLEADG